jgi:uncharacterized protein (DUF305 family)
MKATLIAGCLGLMLAVPGAAADDRKPAGEHAHEKGTITGKQGSKELHGHMKKASAEMRSMRMTGDVDHDFAMAMKRHHEHGIEMAQIVLRDGKDPQVKQFAQKVVTQQQSEVAELEKWLQAHAPAKAEPRKAASP